MLQIIKIHCMVVEMTITTFFLIVRKSMNIPMTEVTQLVCTRTFLMSMNIPMTEVTQLVFLQLQSVTCVHLIKVKRSNQSFERLCAHL